MAAIAAVALPPPAVWMPLPAPPQATLKIPRQLDLRRYALPALGAFAVLCLAIAYAMKPSSRIHATAPTVTSRPALVATVIATETPAPAPEPESTPVPTIAPAIDDEPATVVQPTVGKKRVLRKIKRWRPPRVAKRAPVRLDDVQRSTPLGRMRPRRF